jgi:lipopolysaccharide/colanic/teichoic acid biosynthesis glycosyltransferase
VTTARHCHVGRGALATKRAIDLAVAAVGLVVLSPLLLAIAGVALIIQGRPILFRQRRAGLGGQPFTILKFRTMRPARADEISFHADAQRLTRVGGFLRATSLDELPELWNVLLGDMSVVGPRPLLFGYLDHYTPEEARRHDVRPGMTGWAVVHGRHTIPFEERLRLDVWYVDNWSVSLDLRIIAVTVLQVLGRRGVATVQRRDEIRIPDRFWYGAADRVAEPDTPPGTEQDRA